MALSKRKLIIFIDFGTTYSAVSWLDTTQPAVSELIAEWPGHPTEVAKVPSELRYASNPRKYLPMWGYEIQNNMPRLQWIKLGLDPAGNKQLLHDLALKPRDPRRMDFPRDVTAKSATTDYLMALKEHLLQIFKAEFGSRGVDRLTLQFVVAVPGIWSAEANKATIDCATKAGLAEHLPIKLVSEPEAAAIHTVACGKSDLQVGERFVLCDAGGGTVDLVTMDIKEISPNTRLRQVLPNDGGLCGSTFLNRGFEALVRKRFRNSVWNPTAMSHAFAKFEDFKRSFTGETLSDHIFPVPGLADSRRLNIENNSLYFSTAEIRDVFDAVCWEVVDLIKTQIRRCHGEVDAVVLVGGFGESPYLRQQIRRALKSTNIPLITPSDGWTAVATGALRKVAFDNRVRVDHMACHNYGIRDTVPFNPDIHHEEQKFSDRQSSHKWEVDVMKWFVRMGDSIEGNQPIVTDLIHYSDSKHQVSIGLSIYETRTSLGLEPHFYPRSNMKVHAKISAHFDLKPGRLHWAFWSFGKKGDRYAIPYQLVARYASTHCEYFLRCCGQTSDIVRVFHT